jgi:hypothetical protein
MSAQLSPGRAYRALGLAMMNKIHAVEELRFSRRREAVDIDELTALLADESQTVYNKRRAQIDIEHKRHSTEYIDKLLNDAIVELNGMYHEFKKFPTYTREQFENEEQLHFESRLQLALESEGNGERISKALMTISNNFDELILEVSNDIAASLE